MVVNQKYFTVSERKEIFEILNGVNYKFRQLGSMHTNGMSLYFDDKSKKPIWHISIQTHNDGYRLIYSKFSDKENKWIRKDEQTCKYFDDVLSILKLYREKLDNLKNMNKITESILDRPFTVKWQDNSEQKYNNAIVSVEGLKDIYIKVGRNFRIDLRKYEEYGKRQINYLESHRYDISEKLMELSGMSNDQIQVCLEKLKAEKGTSCTSFLSEFKPKYQNFISEFCSFVKRHHLDSNDDDCFYTFAIEDLKESWENFYTGGDSWADRLCLFYPVQYLYKMDKNDVVDHEKWEDFMSHSSGGHRLEDGYYYTLQDLDEAFEKFEEDKINMNKNLELTLAESFEKTFKVLQKEGLFENVKSFDLELKENKLNIKLNEDEYIPEYPFIEAYFDIIEHRDLWSRIHYDNHTWDEINSKLGEMGCEQFLAKYFDSPETIESMNWETLANIKTEDGQNIMDLLADKFEDIVDYALEDDEIDYRDYSDDDDYDDDDYDEDCREHHRMMYGY